MASFQSLAHVTFLVKDSKLKNIYIRVANKFSLQAQVSFVVIILYFRSSHSSNLSCKSSPCLKVRFLSRNGISDSYRNECQTIFAASSPVARKLRAHFQSFPSQSHFLFLYITSTTNSWLPSLLKISVLTATQYQYMLKVFVWEARWPNGWCVGLRIGRSGFMPWQGHRCVFLDKTLYSHSTSLHSPRCINGNRRI